MGGMSASAGKRGGNKRVGESVGDEAIGKEARARNKRKRGAGSCERRYETGGQRRVARNEGEK